MQIGRVSVGLLGACLLAYLLLRLDVSTVLTALGHAGWLGFGLVLVGGLLLTLCLSSGLYPLIFERFPPISIVLARQVRDSAGDILPFTQIGGIAAGMRVLILAGLTPVRAIAAGMVDVTTELLAQSLFILLGLVLAAPAMRADPHWAPWLGWLAGGTALFALAILGFAVAQLAGSHLAEKALRPANNFSLGSLALAGGASAAAFREAVHQLYRHRVRVALSVVLHLFGWCASGLWLWLVFRVLGHAISPASAIAIQALLEGLRSATVFIPAAIGVQEAGYAALAPLLGLGPEVGLAASLLRRARDVVIGVPVLLLWQFVEARRIGKITRKAVTADR
jgi:putative membrane protein